MRRKPDILQFAEAKRLLNVGRPRDGESGSKTNEVLATFIVGSESFANLKRKNQIAKEIINLKALLAIVSN